MCREVLQIENSGIRARLGHRLESVGLSREDLEALVLNLKRLESSNLNLGIEVDDWPELAEEYAAFFSWLLLDFANTENSQDFNKKLRFEVASLLRTHFGNAIDLSSTRLYLQIQAWVVGKPTSWTSDDCTVIFPMKAIGFWDDNAVKAYVGLIDHIKLLEAIESQSGTSKQLGFPFDLEMSKTSVPIRIMGLAEALVNSRTEGPKDQTNAVISQLQKLKGSARSLIEKQWGSSSQRLEELKWDRNSIAHIWNREDNGHSFAEVVERMTLERTQELGVLASFLMAAELSARLQSVSDRRVLQWYRQVEQDLERQLDAL